MKKILVVDDDVDICNLLNKFLTKNGYDVATVHSGKKALALLKEERYNLLLCDFRLGDMDGMEMLEQISNLNLGMPVIMITGYSDIKVAVNVIKAGAFDYVTKPLYPEEILMLVKKAIEEPVISGGDHAPGHVTTIKKRENSNSDTSFKYLVGESDVARELYRQIDLVAPTNYSVIIHGESGSGKEAIAQAIHKRSLRSNAPFVAMDCGAISKELAGSELFGHEKGSFTGAMNSKIGHFEMANGGTLFLDEVTNLPYSVQVSLLRVVQERKVKRIGGNKEIDLDVRIIVASNENLSEAYRKGRFREDLFHRFNEFSLDVPPLRDRNRDILYFANHFLHYANLELDKEISGFSEDVKKSFLNYAWPGNLREMKNVVKRAALLTDGGEIELKSLPYEIIYNIDQKPAEEVTEHLKPPPSQHFNLKDAALEAEYETILNVLREVKFNKTKAARMLNIDRKTLYNKMKQFNL